MNIDKISSPKESLLKKKKKQFVKKWIIHSFLTDQDTGGLFGLPIYCQAAILKSDTSFFPWRVNHS